jgi:periplasmic protein TonB
MAYADFDQRRSLSPISLGATLAINGCVFAALLWIAPNITSIPRPHQGPIIVQNLPPPKPTPEPETDKPISVASNVITPQPPDPSPVRTRTDRTAGNASPLQGGTETILPPPDPPPPNPIDEAIIDPPLPPPPVWIAAIVHPNYMSALQPPYPPGRQRAEEEGSATVRVTIGISGRVSAVEVVRATHPDFADATRTQALRKWRFKPATKDGVAVESVREMTVRFIMPRD